MKRRRLQAWMRRDLHVTFAVNEGRYFHISYKAGVMYPQNMHARVLDGPTLS